MMRHTADMSDRFDDELAMLSDVRTYIGSVEGPNFPVSTSVIDRVLDERNDARSSKVVESDPGRPSVAQL